MEPLLTKIKKVWFTCEKIKCFVIRYFNKWTVITEVKKQEILMTQLFLLYFYNLKSWFHVAQYSPYAQIHTIQTTSVFVLKSCESRKCCFT